MTMLKKTRTSLVVVGAIALCGAAAQATSYSLHFGKGDVFDTSPTAGSPTAQTQNEWYFRTYSVDFNQYQIDGYVVDASGNGTPYVSIQGTDSSSQGTCLMVVVHGGTYGSGELTLYAYNQFPAWYQSPGQVLLDVDPSVEPIQNCNAVRLWVQGSAWSVAATSNNLTGVSFDVVGVGYDNAFDCENTVAGGPGPFNWAEWTNGNLTGYGSNNPPCQ
jgi:hypothetical protein